jgi:hypothetical protein
MAKPTKSTGTSRIKFIMFDAEIADDQIQSVMQAITSSLRGPAGTPTLRRITAPASAANGNGSIEESSEVEMIDEGGAEQEDALDVTPAAQKKKMPRKPGPKPNIIPIDIDSEPPLSTLGKFKSHHKAYVAIAAWLHDHRATPVISVDHVYTCYRHINWPINLSDFAKPFRELKFRQFFTQPEPGKYAINQLGLAKSVEAD